MNKTQAIIYIPSKKDCKIKGVIVGDINVLIKLEGFELEAITANNPIEDIANRLEGL